LPPYPPDLNCDDVDDPITVAGDDPTVSTPTVKGQAANPG